MTNLASLPSQQAAHARVIRLLKDSHNVSLLLITFHDACNHNYEAFDSILQERCCPIQ